MKKIRKLLPKNDKGLSPMVATIVLIAMVMVIAGILAVGITGSNPDEPRESGISVEGIDPDSDQLTLHMQSGKTYRKSYYLYDNDTPGADGANNNADIKWSQLELRIAGELVKADVEKVTEDGVAVPVDNGNTIVNGENYDIHTGENTYMTDNLGFYIGDILRIENLDPGLEHGDEVVVIWGPQDQTLFTEEV